MDAMFASLRVLRVLGLGFLLKLNPLKRLGQDTIRGYYETRVIIALFNVGFFHAAAGRSSVDLETFAAENDLDLDVLRTLCDYLFSLRILDREGSDYVLSPRGKLIHESLRGAFQIVYAYEDVFYHLDDLLKGKKQYGVEVNRRAEFVAKGSGAVGKLLAFPLTADLLNQNQFERILDLGCGDAGFLKHLCQKNNRVRGYGLDISPEAIAAGRRSLEQGNLENRIQLLVGDVFKIEEVAGQISDIDAATCIYVLHELLRKDRGKTVQMLRNFRKSFPGAALIICEVIEHTPEVLRRRPGGVTDIQLFHRLSKQQLFSREEWRELFVEAGFTNIQEDYLTQVRTAFFTIS